MRASSRDRLRADAFEVRVRDLPASNATRPRTTPAGSTVSRTFSSPVCTRTACRIQESPRETGIVEQTGHENIVIVELNGGPKLTARTPATMPLRIGETVLRAVELAEAKTETADDRAVRLALAAYALGQVGLDAWASKPISPGPYLSASSVSRICVSPSPLQTWLTNQAKMSPTALCPASICSRRSFK